MRTIFELIIYFLILLLKLMKPGGLKSLITEILLLKHQLIVSRRKIKKSPNLTVLDRFLFGLYAFLMNPSRIIKAAIVLKPSTIINFHKYLVKRKYRKLYSNKSYLKPGPKGPSREVIAAILAIKRKNPSYGYPRIAHMISNIFGIKTEPDVVRRVLAKHYKPDYTGTSWLTFIGNMKDSLWSVDFFMCESILLQTHWVMVVMDQYTRKIIGFSVQSGFLCGTSICRMFNEIVSDEVSLPKYLSTDNDPLYKYYRWKANLRIYEINPIKSVPHVPISHPFIERLIGSIRREYLNKTPFWNKHDLKQKLEQYKKYYNSGRVHYSLEGQFPSQISQTRSKNIADIKNFRWKSYCNNLFSTPIAA